MTSEPHASLPEGYAPGAEALAERVILVTGAGRGIGRAAALALASHGATVVLLGRTVRDLEAGYDEITEAGHPEPAIYPMDLEGATPDDHVELGERIGESFGRLDGLLHNAARLSGLSPLEHQDPAEWWRVVQVNLNAPFLLTRDSPPGRPSRAAGRAPARAAGSSRARVPRAPRRPPTPARALLPAPRRTHPSRPGPGPHRSTR